MPTILPFSPARRKGIAPGHFTQKETFQEFRFKHHGYIDQMTEQKLTVLGVYRPQISAETWQEQLQVTGDEAFTRGHFDTLVLIEALVEGLDGPFQMGEFGQMQAEFPNDPTRMQVGYDEGLLSIDGETLIQRQMNCVHGTGPLRFAVYLHMYDPQRSLRWQGGEAT